MQSFPTAAVVSRACVLGWLVFILVSPARAQPITLTVHRESLEKVFRLIEKQSPYTFIYTSESMTNAQPVTLQAKNERLDSVLSRCFRGQPLGFAIQGEYITVRTILLDTLTQHLRNVRGRIENEEGEPVAGITVRMLHTEATVSSDTAGRFAIKRMPGDIVLLVSGAEIEPVEVFAGEKPFILIKVRTRVSLLDETVLVAYGKTTRRLATGAMTKIGIKEISCQPVSNVLSALEGRVAGLQVVQQSGLPGSGFTIRLRGQNSLANGNDPLYIIDGIPFSTIVPVNGTGGGNRSSPLAQLEPSDIESIDVLKDAEATAIYGSRGANGVILISTRKARAGKMRILARGTGGMGVVTREMKLLDLDSYLRMRREAFTNDGTIPTIASARDLLLWDTTRQTDWQEEFVGGAVTSLDSKLEMSGGNNNTQALFGIGYHRETTVLPWRLFGERKFSTHFSLSHHSVDKRWKVSMQLSFLHYDLHLPRSDVFSQIVTLPPNAPRLYDSAGHLNWEHSGWTNPLSLLFKAYRSVRDNLLADITASYVVLPGLDVRINLGYHHLSSHDHSVNPVAAFDPALHPVSSASFGTASSNTIIMEPQIGYSRVMGKLHLDGLIGATLQASGQRSLLQTGSDYGSDELLGSLQAAGQISANNEADADYRYAGFFGRVKMDWKKRYLVSLTGRRDGSSRYGPSNRFANFGAIGFGWIFSREIFLSSSPWLSFGKLRLSAGITGNDQIGDYRYTDTYSSFDYPYLGTTTFIPTQLYNASYSWERVVKREIGLDLGFWRDRILLTVGYYHNTTDNQLIPYALPASTGFSSVFQNVPARIQNTGFEFELHLNSTGSTPVWSSSFTISFPRSRLLRFDQINRFGYKNSYVVGRSLSIVKRYWFSGIDPSSGTYLFEDMDRDGRISVPGDQQFIVSTDQQYYGGWQHYFNCRRFTIGVLFQFVRQKYAQGYVAIFGEPGTISNQPVEVMNRWQSGVGTAKLQRFSNGNGPAASAFANFRLSNGAYEDASFIRLRNVFVAFQLVHRRDDRKMIKDISCFIQAENLFTVTGFRNLDPETKLLMPPLRMIAAGLQLEM